ncbi:hypothetical protein LBMAG42_39180 [Deltaproteobacteria bacterium]|nr:hypothetical protein LBMAG42_39180 [Deltaproteobacteria bacterium]
MLLLLALVAPAAAHGSGQTGNSTSGCSCHGALPSSSVSASFSASASTVEPGDVVNVSFIVGSTSAARAYGGLDVSATGGTFTAGSNTQVRSSEVTHLSATAMTASSITFDMTWTAPTTEGTYSLRGVGQSNNNNGSDSGDAWVKASNLSIIVDDGCEDVDADGYEVCDDGSGTDCDDADAAVNPGEDELCNDVDDDCDDEIDESSAIDAETWYLDDDGDGYGSPSTFTVSCDVPSGYVADDTDCDDAEASVNPAAVERCDTVDNDCDGATDPATSADAVTWYRDADGDGYAGSTTILACTIPSGYLPTSTDCDDALPGVNPAASETCDGADQDCDGATDEDATDARTFYLDSDADGYGESGATVDDCAAPAGYAALPGDCDDRDAAYHPGATETCTDAEDFNCDGSVTMEDLDGDGFVACMECNDGNAAVNPAAAELCNGVDDDCDGAVDPDTAADASDWYADVDSDGFGDPAVATQSCLSLAGYVADSTDCDDADATAFPGAPETCDGADDDCNGAADDAAVDANVYFADADADAFGDAATSISDCSAPSGYVSDSSDCDDADAAVSPSGGEVCDGVDNDCDGTTDEPDASDATFWYADADGDGYGDATVATIACSAPADYVADALDCDDGAAAVNPAAAEVWYDGVDDDCDGNDADADLDGWLYPADCNDADATVNPDAMETPYDGLDADCSGGSDFDADGDGFDSEAFGGSDCDDADASTYAGAPDLGDGVEHDCDVRNDHDRDDDGYDDAAFGGDDCDDANSAINPAATDTWYDGIDADCDGSDDYDQDHDGVRVDEDCDDTDREIALDCDSGDPADSGDSGDTGDSGDSGGDPDADADPSGDSAAATPDAECGGCAADPSAGTLPALLLAAAALRRRRPSPEAPC